MKTADFREEIKPDGQIAVPQDIPSQVPPGKQTSGGKVRPVVVLHDTGDDDLVVAPVTSRPRDAQSCMRPTTIRQIKFGARRIRLRFLKLPDLKLRVLRRRGPILARIRPSEMHPARDA